MPASNSEAGSDNCSFFFFPKIAAGGGALSRVREGADREGGERGEQSRAVYDGGMHFDLGDQQPWLSWSV